MVENYVRKPNLYFFLSLSSNCICSHNLTIMSHRHASKLKVIIFLMSATANIQAFNIWAHWREVRGETARVWRCEKRESLSKGIYLLSWCPFTYGVAFVSLVKTSSINDETPGAWKGKNP